MRYSLEPSPRARFLCCELRCPAVCLQDASHLPSLLAHCPKGCIVRARQALLCLSATIATGCCAKCSQCGRETRGLGPLFCFHRIGHMARQEQGLKCQFQRPGNAGVAQTGQRRSGVKSFSLTMSVFSQGLLSKQFLPTVILSNYLFYLQKLQPTAQNCARLLEISSSETKFYIQLK